MNICQYPQPFEHAPCVVAIGNFDGVHKGHRYLLSEANKVAEEHDLPLIVLTFEPHPRAVLMPEKAPMRLTKLAEKAERLQQNGVAQVAVAEFTAEFAQMSPQAFINDILVSWLSAQYVVVGEGFRYGHKASGDVALLKKMGMNLEGGGFQVHALAPLRDANGEIISSSRLRAAKQGGDQVSVSALS